MSTQDTLNQSAERLLFAALQPPDSRPGARSATRAAAHCLQAFIERIDDPTPLLIEIANEYACMHDGPLTPSPGALGRFTTRYPVWQLFIELHQHVPAVVLHAAGAALADALISENAFPKNLARQLLRAVEQKCSPREIQRLDAYAAGVRVRYGLTGNAESAEPPLRVQLKNAFRIFNEFAGEHAHQARGSRWTLSDAAYREAAFALRQRVESGEQQAVWMCVAALAGLNARLCGAIPLRGPASEFDALIDVAEGLFLLDLDIVAPAARRAPPPGSDVVIATRVVVRPMPGFLHSALLTRQQIRPEALTLRELFDCTTPRSYDELCLTPYPGGFKPTLARFQRSTESFAVRIGIHRILAGHLGGRYLTATRSKLYYVAVDRPAIWSAATRLFDEIGWGAPTPLHSGPAIGAMTVATDDAVSRWFHWMLSDVESVAPGRRTGLERLLDHHNRYARATASLITFCVALREANEIPVDANAACAAVEIGWLNLCDKGSPTAWNQGSDDALDHAVPFCRVAREQIGCWRRHCAALERRLRQRGPDVAVELRDRALAVADGEPVAAFFIADAARRPRTLKSRDLTRWWPDWFAMPPNWSRAYWQTTLTNRELRSSTIDVLMRHTQAGTEFGTNTTSKVKAQAIADLNNAMSAHLDALGIHAIRGIVA